MCNKPLPGRKLEIGSTGHNDAPERSLQRSTRVKNATEQIRHRLLAPCRNAGRNRAVLSKRSARATSVAAAKMIMPRRARRLTRRASWEHAFHNRFAPRREERRDPRVRDQGAIERPRRHRRVRGTSRAALPSAAPSLTSSSRTHKDQILLLLQVMRSPPGHERAEPAARAAWAARRRTNSGSCKLT